MSIKISDVINKKNNVVKFKHDDEYYRKKKEKKEKQEKEKQERDVKMIEVYNMERELSLFNDNIKKHIKKYTEQNSFESFNLLKQIRSILFKINLEI